MPSPEERMYTLTELIKEHEKFSGTVEPMNEKEKEEVAKKAMSALDIQVGGNHYKHLKIQPVEYCYRNNIPFIEGNIIKYVTRWKDKGGIESLRKARHFIDLLIDFEMENGEENERRNERGSKNSPPAEKELRIW